jgi:hypothetical protein
MTLLLSQSEAAQEHGGVVLSSVTGACSEWFRRRCRRNGRDMPACQKEIAASSGFSRTAHYFSGYRNIY